MWVHRNIGGRKGQFIAIGVETMARQSDCVLRIEDNEVQQLFLACACNFEPSWIHYVEGEVHRKSEWARSTRLGAGIFSNEKHRGVRITVLACCRSIYHAFLGMGQQWRPSHRGALYHATAPLQHGCFGGKDRCGGFVWLWQRWKAGVWWLMNHAWFSMQSTIFCGCGNYWISPRVGWRWANFQPDVRWSWWWRNFSGSMNVESV